MTTLDGNAPTFFQFLTWKAAQKSKERRERTVASATAGTWVTAIVRLVLHLAGFGCLTFAGFTWNITAGFIVAGVSFFALSWLTTAGQRPEADDVNRPHQTRR